MKHHIAQKRDDVFSFAKDFRKNWKHTIKRFLRHHRHTFVYLIVLFITSILLIPFITYAYFAKDLQDKDNIMNRSKTGLTLLDRSGKPFFTFYQPKEITYVPLDQIPQNLQQAVIATEDKNFYTNPGFSIRGILRALLADLQAGRIVEGGSTITQELVKNALLSQSQNFLRKYQEIVLAYEINRRYSKHDILEMYLNSVYFGEGAFGIENAAEAYFGIPAKDLSLSQSALLTGLLPAPSAYSPLSNDPAIAKSNQRQVLTRMVQTGYITKEQADNAYNEPLAYHPIKQTVINSLAPHFALYVKDDIIKHYGEERVIRDGFVVQTTLNSDWQRYAENVVKNDVARLAYDKASNGAAVAINPKTGEIEIMVGSIDWNNEQFGKANMAITPRQPGSSFKPIVYAYALSNHLITPATIMQDTKTTFAGNYEPHDFDRGYRGPVTVRRALANSLNIPAVQVMQQVGVSNTLDMAKKLGITTLGNDPSNYGLSLVLGAGEVKLLEMTGAYSVFANQGMYNQPISVLQIKDKYGDVIYQHQPHPQQVLDDGTAYLITSILSDNNARAEEFDGLLTISRRAAVKTGTTEDFRDALTIGYTPSLAIGVWVGNNDNKPMDNIAGALGAAPIWRSLMEDFLAGTPVEKFKQPSSVVSENVCPYRDQGSPLASGSAYTEYFLLNSQPLSCGLSSPNTTIPLTNTPAPTPPTSPTPTQGPFVYPTYTPAPSPTPLTTPTDTPAPQPTLQLTPTLPI